MNLFGFVSSADVVVAYPFASPAYVAECCGVPAVYFDPTNQIAYQSFDQGLGLVRFASTAEQLADQLMLALTANRKRDYQ